MNREARSTNILVVGMGSWAFGKERRAVSTLSHMHQVKPHFLTSKWEDGSVSRLLRGHNFEFTPTSLGYLGCSRPTWTLINVLQMPRLFLTAVNTYLRRNCEAVLLLSIQSFVNILPAVLFLKWFSHAKVVFYLGDIPINNSIFRAVGRIVNGVAGHVIANSEAVKRGLLAVGIDERKIRVIYNGVDPREFGDASPMDFRQRFGWPLDTVVVGYVGQFSRNKGVGDFVKAAELVLEREERCRFVMIGGLDEWNDCQQELRGYVRSQGLKDSVVFTGRIDEMEKAYAGLDTIVVPSRYDDPAPNVNIEAMASGIPVVATRMGGNPEIVIDGETGFLVEKGKPKQIAECIVRLARDEPLRKRLGNGGRKRAYEMFDVRKNAGLLEMLILQAD